MVGKSIKTARRGKNEIVFRVTGITSNGGPARYIAHYEGLTFDLKEQR